MPNVDDVVTLQIEVTAADYELLRSRAEEARLPMDEFIAKALWDGSFVIRHRAKGNRVLVETRRGLRELVD